MRKDEAPKMAPEMDLRVVSSGDGGFMRGCRLLSACGGAVISNV